MNLKKTMPAAVGPAVAALRAGGLVAFPTETVYGLGADASNPAAVAKIFAAKGRPADHPLIVHLGGAGQLPQWASVIPPDAWTLAEAFWPGPLTIVLPRRADVPAAVSGGLDTVALRVPAHPLAMRLLAEFGGGVAAPSANRYGRVSPTTAAHVREELAGAVDVILDGGPSAVGIESTIVDLCTPEVRVLRPGTITLRSLKRVLGKRGAVAGGADVRCPGNKASHYAPDARVILTSMDDAAAQAQVWRDRGKRVGVLAPVRPVRLPQGVIWMPFGVSARQQAKSLYASLREADARGIEVLLAVAPPDSGVGQALRDRLRRAAGPRAGAGTVS